MDELMSSREFYHYIIENFNLDGVSARLVKNILNYIESQGFVDQEDNHAHLDALLVGAFGLKNNEIKKCHFGGGI